MVQTYFQQIRFKYTYFYATYELPTKYDGIV